MKKLLGILLGLVLVPTLALAGVREEIDGQDSVNVSVGGAKQAVVDAVGDDFYVFVGGHRVNFELEPDEDGAETLAQITVYSCSNKSTTSCFLAKWDSDGDGVKDTAVLTGADDGQRGVAGIEVPYYLLFDVTVAPTNGVAVLSISAVAQGL